MPRRVMMLCCAAALIAARGSALGQGVRVVLLDDEALGPPGHAVTSIGATATNGIGGFAVFANTSDGANSLSHLAGVVTAGVATPGALTVLHTEAMIGSFLQQSFEGEFGFSDAGQVSYSATGTQSGFTTLDSGWLDQTPLAIQRDPAPAFPGQFWSFASRFKMTHSGMPYWRGGVATTAGGASVNRSLLKGNPAASHIKGGDMLPNLPAAIATSGGGFIYRFSGQGTHSLSVELLQGATTATDQVVVMDGAGLMLDGQLVREGSPIPAAIGGRNGENWGAFDEFGVTESGRYYIFGDSSDSATLDDFILSDGVMRIRGGDTFDGEVLDGDIAGASVNESGDYAALWDVQANTVEVLMVHHRIVLREGDEIDLDRDGTPDPGARLFSMGGTGGIAITNRIAGLVRVYLSGGVDINGTTSTTDDVEVLLEIEVCLPDVNRSGGLSVQDIFDFLGFYFSGDLRADFDNSFSISVQDIFDFLALYFGGC